jgi:hypothetical protein
VVIDNDRPPRRARLVVALALAFVLAGALALAAGVLSACSGSAAAVLRSDGGLRVRMDASIPSPLAARLRALSSLPADAPLFDAKNAAGTMAARPGLSLVSASSPDPDSISATVDVRDLRALLAAPDLASTGAVRLAEGSGWKELRVRLARGSVTPLVNLVPGLDPALVDALSPPALDPDPIGRADYRRMLAGIVGEKAAVALDTAVVVLRLTAPSAVLASSGGGMDGQTLVVRVPVLDLLVLEKPLEFSLRWSAQ